MDDLETRGMTPGMLKLADLAAELESSAKLGYVFSIALLTLLVQKNVLTADAVESTVAAACEHLFPGEAFLAETASNIARGLAIVGVTQ